LTQLSIDPSQTYVFLAPDGSSEQSQGGDAFWSGPDLARFGQGWLVSEFECEADWPSWEMHPNGDEFVYLLSGDATFQLELEGGVRSVRMKGRGAVVVPRGTWHTAKVSAPSRVLFVTFGEGTQHRPA
jgi:mannose-6-phosphate isomerase-like protein (cupin superfamily)